KFISHVIKECFTEPQNSIEVYDRDKDKRYSCKLKSRKERIETYICKGRYEFVEARCLGNGDVLNFSIEYPPASCLTVSVDKSWT
ncbi:hypothetical protein RYX36_016525, partial [Vicia faba]